MNNTYHNFSKFLAKSKKKNPFFYYYTLGTIFLIIILPLFWIFFWLLPKNISEKITQNTITGNIQTRRDYHGPNPLTELTPEPQKRVLSAKNRSNKRTESISARKTVQNKTLVKNIVPNKAVSSVAANNTNSAPATTSPVTGSVTPVSAVTETVSPVAPVADSNPVSTTPVTEASIPITPMPPVSAKSDLSSGQYGVAAGGGLTSLSQPELNAYFESLKALGTKWVRWDVDWSVVQPDNSATYRWTEIDRVALAAKNFGINSLGIITYTPKWARLSSCSTELKCSPADLAAFGRFAAQTALRYKDTISFWEIWNEPNIAYSRRWGIEANVKKYADILKIAYTEIKKVNPSAFIIGGSLAASGDEADGSLSPLTFMNGLYVSGAREYFDAISLHPYTYPASPNYIAPWNHWQEMLPIRDLMVKNNDEAKKVWITEYGAPTGGPGKTLNANQIEGKFYYGVDFMSDEAQKIMMVEAIDFVKNNASWIDKFFWYSLKDISIDRSDPENFFGLLRYDGSQKSAYGVFQSTISSN